ncbi:GNAT family N-acetyltransferase [Limnochorda pilosa]|uniref:Acetyltransferase n=1 Tax=Limnochorda pilosa TaxID=1555112 RepID=A0A0K2SHD5_LIMPI|nr:GNAT family N-acetyltransferase [Limnochorda pilosa]BAS26528.1 acetyltransferase [Limnochorda pilosa]
MAFDDPILRDIPTAFETERLLIRAPRPGDGPELNAAVLESLDDLRPWMPWADHAPSLEESERNVRHAHVRFLAREDLRLHLFLKGTETLVGGSGLHRMDWRVPKFEIGYWCRTSFQGQGYVTEAVRGICSFAFEVLGARRLEIRCDPRNERSRRVAERAGFRLEGHLHNDTVDPSGWVRDTLIYGLLPEG